MHEQDVAVEAGGRSRVPLACGPVALVALAAAVVHLAVATRYGWHRDEFYYVICGRHPAWGYVDQPPLTPLLAAAAVALPGGLWPLRVGAVALQIGCVLLTAVLAAEFGGRRRGWPPCTRRARCGSRRPRPRGAVSAGP